ncbi:MAG: tryptophan tryptophylquinone biosynthesis enzyme MauG [Gammaproteobacteria bacterium]|nr:tryptophan tryptophylquinone biosynthesis enzyme MauG [Gammaproteobacteria bacterium]
MLCLTALSINTAQAVDVVEPYTLVAGHESLRVWLLSDLPIQPEANASTAARISLGKQLFFDPRLSGDKNMACASCHNPLLGWADGLATGKGFQSQTLPRATPTIINTSYNFLQMWDGRKPDLEEQALGPLTSANEMRADLDTIVIWLKQNNGYKKAFAEAYPDEAISAITLAKAIATYERTIISNNSAFDRWIKGDPQAMTAQQIKGFKLFLDPNKGNCVVCHQPGNFVDDGFHNIGLESSTNGDLGRFAQKAVKSMRGSFKTPTLRDIELTAPYFHNGSAKTLLDVINHYAKGGIHHDNLSPNMKALTLTQSEKQSLVEFMKALTTPHEPLTLPTLPLN